MIRKMTKYSFILLNEDKDKFLEELSNLGVMDITRSAKAIDEKSAAMFDMNSRFKRGIAFLEGLDFSKDPDQEQIKAASAGADTGRFPVSLEETRERAAQVSEAIAACEKEIKAVKIWGEFSQEEIGKITALGYGLHFFRTPAKAYDKAWEEQFAIQVIERDEDVWFVILTPAGETPKYPVNELAAPSRSASEAAAERDALKAELISLKGRMLAMKGALDEIRSTYASNLNGLDLYLAGECSPKAAEDKLVVMEGFAPEEIRGDLEKKLSEMDVYYIAEEATGEDNPPVKLKNNWFARAFETIGNMYLLPRYDELDLTPYFAPFYMLFFGLCVGDLGYGLILLGIGLYVHFKMPKMSGIGTLISFLGVGSCIMPMLSGTFFGAKIYDIIPMSDKITGMFLTDIQLFWFAIIFGIFHLVVARIIAGVYATVKHGWQAGLSSFGWAAFTLWAALYFAEWNSKGELTLMSPALNWTLLGIAGVGIIFFSNLSRNIFVRLFKGVAAVYDVTGLLGDALSYIRLFGLGMSGGILGMVFNAMAFQLSDIPYVGWLLTVILLLLGHTLTILLSCLGAFVHPMRLTFVEFYKNAGFIGGGRPYRPLDSKRTE